MLGKPLHRMDEEARRARRGRSTLVLFFSRLCWIPTLNALENVELPMRCAAPAMPEPGDARALLEQLGLGKRLHHLPAQLSGGEQQRVALAGRLTGARPFCSPMSPPATSIARPGTKLPIWLFSLNREHGTTLILVTHDPLLAGAAIAVCAWWMASCGGSMIARWFWREWRSPSLLIVWLALSLAVACVLALGSISDRMEKGLSQQAVSLWPATVRCAVRARYPPSGSHRRGSQADRRRAAELCHHDVRRGYAAAGGR